MMNKVLFALLVINSLLELMVLGFTPGAVAYVFALALIEIAFAVSVMHIIN